MNTNEFGNVSEVEDENQSESSSEEDPRNKLRQSKVPKSKTYSIGYLTKKIWANKIYSDDFDIDKAAEEKPKRPFPSIAANQAIMEDIEYSELENPYFSDNSSASQLSTKLRAFSRELAKV